MKLQSVKAIVEALNAAGVRYLVAGGLAVLAHGYPRYTKDVDLVVQLAKTNLDRAFKVLSGLGYRPALPVAVSDFADPSIRESWIREKGMTVFQFWSDEHRETPIDIFVKEPFDFDREYETALHKYLFGRVEVPIVSLSTLIAMKKAAGRPEDQLDIENLKKLERR